MGSGDKKWKDFTCGIVFYPLFFYLELEIGGKREEIASHFDDFPWYKYNI